MTLDELKASKHWPEEGGDTDEAVDMYCPLRRVYFFLRRPGQPGKPLVVTNPTSADYDELIIVSGVPDEDLEALQNGTLYGKRAVPTN